MGHDCDNRTTKKVGLAQNIAAFLAVAAVMVWFWWPKGKPGRMPSPPSSSEIFLDSKIRTDPYFKSLPKNRQDAVTRAVADEFLNKEILEVADVTAEEVGFLIEKGLYEKPTWPGYKTFVGESGVLTLVPEAELSSRNAEKNGEGYRQ